MSLSVSQSGGDAAIINDIIAGGAGFEARLKVFKETAAQADEAKALIREAHAKIQEAASRMAEAERAAAAAKAEQGRVDAEHARLAAARARIKAIPFPPGNDATEADWANFDAAMAAYKAKYEV